ncbi:MAG: hypothetical protein GX556_04195 [Fibrobacter sp.]|nr:hypothetical protein [Fibrobacter sp.]
MLDTPGGFFFAKGNFENDAAYIFSEYSVLRLNVQTKQIDSLDYPVRNRFNYRINQNQAMVRTDSSFLFYDEGTIISEHLTCARSNYEFFSADRYGMFILYKAFDDMIYILNIENDESILLFPYKFENRL